MARLVIPHFPSPCPITRRADTEGAGQPLRIHLVQSPQMNEKHPPTHRIGRDPDGLCLATHRTFPATSVLPTFEELLQLPAPSRFRELFGNSLMQVCCTTPQMSPVITTGLQTTWSPHAGNPSVGAAMAGLAQGNGSRQPVAPGATERGCLCWGRPELHPASSSLKRELRKQIPGAKCKRT